MPDCGKYVDYIMEQTKNLLTTGSPSGCGREVTGYLLEELGASGVQTRCTVKEGVTTDFGGRSKEDGILLETHCGTLRGMVAQVKENGRLELTNIGSMRPVNAEIENMCIITKADGIYEGTYQLVDVSVHVDGSYEKTEHTWNTVEVLVDEDVMCREDATRLSIMPGGYVHFEPRARITLSGYIKSRFLDDKLSATILVGYAKCLKDESVTLERWVYAHFTIYEEVGHGSSVSVPEGVIRTWPAGMGCVREGLQCTEHEVSICAKDNGGPYNCDVLCRLVELAKEHGIGCAVDVYLHYGSDVKTIPKSGHDVRHALIGLSAYASHGYKRSHRDGAGNTFRPIQAHIG